jgi:GxxExxY protein
VTTLRLASTLTPEIEELARNTIGALLSVHRELGAGLSKAVYGAAARIELFERGIPFESEKAIAVRYKDRLLCYQRIDLFVNGQLVVELKSVEEVHPVHVAQVVSYLRLSGARLGLLVNFNVPLLRQGIRRVVR